MRSIWNFQHNRNLVKGFIMKNKIYYQCFSSNLKDFLFSKNFRYLLECRHKETLKPIWIYLYDDKGLLDQYLEEWKTIRVEFKDNEKAKEKSE